MASPAHKRIMQEIREIQREGGGEVAAEAMEDDIFEWYFAIRGPRDSDFAGGIYLGRLTLPPDYPLAPPSFTMLTRSGRFEVGARVCLSISGHHADLWSPSWSVRSALLALAAFLPTPAAGAVGSVEGWPAEEVRAAAAASRERAPRVPGGGGGGGGGKGGTGSTAAERRQAVVDRLHARLLDFEREQEEAAEKEGKGKGKQVAEAGGKEAAAREGEREDKAALAAAAEAPPPALASSSSSADAPPLPAAAAATTAAAAAAAAEGAGSGLRQRQQPGAEAEAAAEAAAAAAAPRQRPPPLVAQTPSPAPASSPSSSSWEDALLTGLAGALLFAIAGILARKMLLQVLL